MQCDNCRKFEPAGGVGWMIVQEILGLGLLGVPAGEIAGTFCSWRCLAQWAYARDAITSAAEGKEN